ncbi:MAG: FtsQ-type POTRA domain-containing protein [Deltaproteobacteria bacterium]|nr:FtsQ-type POTRA domain-containing protein [Deltaproteobacteria bacterium]
MSFFLEQQVVRLRERRRKAWRRWRRRIERIAVIVLAWCVGMGVLFGGYMAVTMLPLFAVDEVVVQGDLRFLAAEAVRERASVAIGTNIFRVPLTAVQERLRGDPWVAEVAVRRKLPCTVWIYIGERRPAALLNVEGLYLVDEAGVIFKQWQAGDPADLPILSGVTEVQVDNDGLGHSGQMRELLEAKEVFERTAVGEAVGLAEVARDRYGRLTVVTERPTLVLRIGERMADGQLRRLHNMLPVLPGGRNVAVVDLRVDRRIVVR